MRARSTYLSSPLSNMSTEPNKSMEESKVTDTQSTVPGFDAAGVAAGIKKSGDPDLALITSRVACRAAAVFTRNQFPAPPVAHGRQLLSANPNGIHGVIINSGNANASTGVEGRANVRRTAEAVEQAIGASDSALFVMSTGVIGVQLPMEKVLAGVPRAVEALSATGWADAARAIMTTDTRPKLATRELELEGETVKITGIAKGSGMIHPDMATMLSVVATNANIAQPLLQQALEHATAHSFNRISVDGDTSTNDAVLVLANGLAAHGEIVDAAGEGFTRFQEALTDLCIELAQAIVRDGEGATKFVTIRVAGAASDADAHEAANTIAISPLCKTAFFGGDANWGRFTMALGRSRAQVEPESCSIQVAGGERGGERLSPLEILCRGTPTDYAEADAAKRFAQPEIDVHVDLGLGEGEATVWTCDLSHEYVTINGDYRT